MVVIYLDSYFVLNFCMDGILLLMLAAVMGEKTSIRRFFAAAVLGAAGSCLLLLFTIPFLLRALLGYAGLNFLMSKLLYPHMRIRALFQSTVLLAVLAAVLGGVLNWCYYSSAGGSISRYLQMTGAEHIHPQFLILLSLGLFVLLVVVKKWLLQKKQLTENVYTVCLELGGKKIGMRALYDTGNCLYTQTSIPVSIVNAQVLYKEIPSLMMSVKTLKEGKASGEADFFLQLLPFESVGGNGLLPVVKGDRLLIYIPQDANSKMQAQVKIFMEPMLGLSEKPFGKAGKYGMILHQQMLEGKEGKRIE